MKKLLTSVSAAAGSVMLFVTPAFAKLTDSASDITTLSTATDLHGAIIDVITTVLDYILIIGVVYVIYAGIRLITSGGDEGSKDKAKQTIIYVIVGIIVVLMARVIVSFVNNLLG